MVGVGSSVFLMPCQNFDGVFNIIYICGGMYLYVYVYVYIYICISTVKQFVNFAEIVIYKNYDKVL